MSKIANALVRFLYPRGTIRTVLFGPIRGMKFKVAPEYSMGATFAFGVDAFHQRWLAKTVRPGMIIYDIGANAGQMAMHFSRFVGPQGKVISFEPVPQVFAGLQCNIALNKITNVQAHCAAVGNKSGQEEFAFNEERPTTGKVLNCEPSYVDAQRQRVQVDMISLNDFCREGVPLPNVIKIDVEGGAGLVLAGAARVIERCAPGFFIEQHGPEENQAIKQYLIDRGYRAETLSGEHVVDPTVGWHNPLWCVTNRSQG